MSADDKPWQPMYVPIIVRDRLRATADAPRSVEWVVGQPEHVTDCASDTARLVWAKWMLPQTSLPHGLQLELRTDDHVLVYGVWYTQADALVLRDRLLEWWPLDKYPGQP